MPILVKYDIWLFNVWTLCKHLKIFLSLVKTTILSPALPSRREMSSLHSTASSTRQLSMCHAWLMIESLQWGSKRTNNIDGAEPVRVSHDAILVSRMHLAIMALCKQTTDNFRTRNPPESRWRHLSGNRILFVPHYTMSTTSSRNPCSINVKVHVLAAIECQQL